MKYSAGPLAHEKMMRSIQLYGEKVIPLVRDMTRQNAPSGILCIIAPVQWGTDIMRLKVLSSSLASSRSLPSSDWFWLGPKRARPASSGR